MSYPGGKGNGPDPIEIALSVNWEPLIIGQVVGLVFALTAIIALVLYLSR